MYEQSACEALVASVNSVNDDTVTRDLTAHHVRFRLELPGSSYAMYARGVSDSSKLVIW